MQEMSLWGIATILGPIILIGLFIWVIVRNRSAKVSEDVTERATKANYEAEDNAHKDDAV